MTNPLRMFVLWESKLHALVQRALAEGMKQPFTLLATDRHGNTVGGAEPLVWRGDAQIKIEGTADGRVFLPFYASLTDSGEPPRSIEASLTEQEAE